MSYQELQNLPEEIRRDIQKVMGQAAIVIPNVVRPRSPIDTGHLRRSWKGRASKYQAVIRNTAAYAEYIESGTVKMAARPNLYLLLPDIEAELERSILTGTDFYLKGGAFSDATTQLKQGYKNRYGNYGSHRGYSV